MYNIEYYFLKVYSQYGRYKAIAYTCKQFNLKPIKKSDTVMVLCEELDQEQTEPKLIIKSLPGERVATQIYKAD